MHRRAARLPVCWAGWGIWTRLALHTLAYKERVVLWTRYYAACDAAYNSLNALL